MSDFLQQIVAHKRQEIAVSAARLPAASLRLQASLRRDYRGFAAALAAERTHVIAEIKRASPSKGVIRADVDPAALARAYEAGGATALSVLTETAFFRGSPGDLAAARGATRLPVLRKDFVIDPYQVYESAGMGADAILLIVRILTDAELARLHALALELGLDALVEVHDEDEALRARRLGARLVGINNRNLSDFQVDPSRALRVSAVFPKGTLLVAASGISGLADIRAARAAGISRFLVGEALVRATDPTALLREWVAPGETV